MRVNYYFWGVIKKIIIFIVLILIIKTFFLTVGIAEGSSMEPNFYDNGKFFVNKFIYLVRPPERYEVVQLVDLQSKNLVIKRIIGLPGDMITIRRGGVYLQEKDETESKRLAESYISSEVYTRVLNTEGQVHFSIGPEEYFILGDNRLRSTDSRVFGSVNRRNITGLVVKIPFLP